MGYQIISTALAPILVVQGKKVKRNALQLPEAAGARNGTFGTGPELSLLVVGDSAAAGVGVASQDEAITGCLVATLSAQHTVNWTIIATSGHRLSHLLNDLNSANPQKVSLLVISIGINDVLIGTSVRDWKLGLRSLFDLVHSKFSPEKVALCGIPPLQSFPILPQPLRWYMGLRAKRLNDATIGMVKQSPCWRYIDLSLPMIDTYLAHDQFHPNAHACKLWSEIILSRI